MFKYVLFKSFIDILFSIVIMILFLPFIILVLIILSVDLKENPIFVQKRTGFKGRVFELYKFKTMKSIRNSKGKLISDYQRVSTLGKLLRKLSIDELPQLVNILKGEMSFIGLRPLLVEYLPLYNSEQIKRHKVLPGISGYAQVNGRNSISWNEKFKLDVYYVRNQSFFLDLKILILTIKRVVTSHGINSNSKTSMEKFNGQN